MNYKKIPNDVFFALAIVSFAWVTPTVAQQNRALRVSTPPETSVFNPQKQYFVNITCNVHPDFAKRAGKINNSGKFSGLYRLGRNYKLVHFISISKAAMEFTRNATGNINNSTANKFGHMVIPYAYVDTGNSGTGIESKTGMGCKQALYLSSPKSTVLEGRVGYSWDNTRPANDTSLVAVAFGLVTSLGEHLGKLAFGGALSGGALGSLTNADNTANAIDTFLNAFRGAKMKEDALYLRPGTTLIKTDLSTVTIQITEKPSYLEADGVPFSNDGYETFRELAWTALTTNNSDGVSKFTGWVAAGKEFDRSSTGKQERQKLGAFCAQMYRILGETGLRSKTDRTYVMSKIVAQKGGDAIGNLRCLSNAGLVMQMTRGKGKKELNKYLKDDGVVFSAQNVETFKKTHPDWDLGKPATDFEPDFDINLFLTKAKEIAINWLLPGAGAISKGNQNAAYMLTPSLVEGTVEVFDPSGVMLPSGSALAKKHHEFVALFRDHNFKHWGCYESNKRFDASTSTGAEDISFFQGASGAFAVMEGIPDPNGGRKPKFSPEQAVLVLAYMDKVSGEKFSHFVIQGRPYRLFDKDIGACNEDNKYITPEPEKVNWSHVVSVLADVWDYGSNNQSIPDSYSEQLTRAVGPKLAIQNPTSFLFDESNRSLSLEEFLAALGSKGFRTFLGILSERKLSSAATVLDKRLVFGTAQHAIVISDSDATNIALLRVQLGEFGKLVGLRLFKPSERQKTLILDAL